MKDSEFKVQFKNSLKSWDTENKIDRIFYRPIGYRIALLLKPTSITPNSVTIFSIFVGIGACLLFYPDNNLLINLAGFALLVFANILDCVDGQLARIKGASSKIGRILDGLTGDIWFLTFYTVMALRMIGNQGWGLWPIAIVFLSAVSHINQAGIVDYYKTLHLHFLKKGKNSDFENTASIKANYMLLSWKKEPVSKIFMKFYFFYTLNQERNTPQLHNYITHLDETFPDGYPDDKIAAFREKSLKIMPLLNGLTFNARSVIILITLLFHIEWLYFAVEILIFNPLLWIAMLQHETMCKNLNK
jgi:phosphatidylglycerophosphate synthase